MLYSELDKYAEVADGGMASKKVFTGCRIAWTDEKNRYHFGVVISTNGDLINAIDDVGNVKLEINFLHAHRFEDWLTQKDTGRKTELTANQKRAIELGKKSPTDPKKYFTRKVMLKWGRPLLRGIFLYSNRTFFGNKLLVKQSVCPPMDKKKQVSGAMAVYYSRTRKLAVNPEFATTIEQVFICLVHEMIHMYDDLIRRELNKPSYNAHGPWFKKYAQKIEKYMNVVNIYSIQDNWEEDADPNLRMSGEFDVDTEEDDLTEKSSKPYWMILLFQQIKYKERTQNYLRAIRMADENRAYAAIEKLEGFQSARFFLYKMDLAYFEKLLPTGAFKASNVNKLSRAMSPQQVEIIRKHGEPDTTYGDLFKWLNKKGLKIDNNTQLKTENHPSESYSDDDE